MDKNQDPDPGSGINIPDPPHCKNWERKGRSKKKSVVTSFQLLQKYQKAKGACSSDRCKGGGAGGWVS